MKNEGTPTVSQIIDRLKLFYGYKFDTQVARRLGLSDGSAIGNWRRRNSIDILLVAEHCTDINYDWLLWGRGKQASADTEHRAVTPEDFAYLRQTGIPRERIITLVNEALQRYLMSENEEVEEEVDENQEVEEEVSESEEETVEDTEE